MGRQSETLSRVAAGFTGALAVGLVAGLVLGLVDALTCGPTCTSTVGDATGHQKCLEYDSTCQYFAARLLFGTFWTSVLAVVLGMLPGYAALTLTPARIHPWRSLLVLVPGTLLGFIAWLVWQTYARIPFGLLTLFLLPSITGLIVALNIERLPKPFRPWAKG